MLQPARASGVAGPIEGIARIVQSVVAASMQPLAAVPASSLAEWRRGFLGTWTPLGTV